jgi:hypothetical protein
MGKNGIAALRARELYIQGIRPCERAWRTAAAEVFADSPESIVKSCPCGAFTGLCEAGMVRGIPPAASARAVIRKNASYAITAAHLLAADPRLADAGPTKLWRTVMEETGSSPSKRPNGQMDVVLSLWTKGFLAAPEAL